MKKIKYIIYLFVALFATTSCEDFLNITPEGQSKRDPQLSTPQGIEDAMYGVYSQLRSPSLYGQELHFQTIEVLAHNLHCAGRTTIEALGKFEYENTSVKSIFDGMWTAMYKNISNVNSVLDAPLVAEANGYPYTIYRGEALGLRAFMHFDLVRLFAEQYTVNPEAEGIPYATEFSLKTPDFESLAKNYEHILKDLHEAEALLENEDDYENASNFMLDRQIHFNKRAVWATLARVYMTKGDKENAAKYAKKVIDDGKYILKEKTEVQDDLAGVLSRKECIFGIYYPGLYENVYAILQQTTTRYSLDLRNDYATIYERDNSGNDFRINAYFSAAVGSSDVYRLSKLTNIYELRDEATPDYLIRGINMIRIPEMYYILAEALLESDYNAAIGYYNAVREHRGLIALGEEPDEPEDSESSDSESSEPETVAEENVVGDDLLTIARINDERFKEYIGEGQTFFNMKRLNLPIVSFDGATTYAASKNIYVVPVPDAEKENRY